MMNTMLPPNAHMSNRRRLFVALALFLVTAFLGGLALVLLRVTQLTQTTAIPSGTPSGELAFVSDRDGTWDVFLLTADGRLTNLTPERDGDPPGADDYFASWDFKSERINFIADRTGELGPVQVFPNGSNLRTLGIADAVMTLFFEGRLDWDPAWTADGQRLVWSSLRDLNLEIYAASTEPDATPTRITNTPARDWFPSWSPDGTQIAFTSDRSGSEDIYVVNADGTNLRQLTTHEQDDIHPAWTLDGKSLVFVSEREVALTTGRLLETLHIIPVDGDETTIRKLRADEIIDCDPIYAADGRVLVFSSNRSGTWQLYQQHVDGTGLQQLTDSTMNSLFPVWRPVVKSGEVDEG